MAAREEATPPFRLLAVDSPRLLGRRTRCPYGRMWELQWEESLEHVCKALRRVLVLSQPGSQPVLVCIPGGYSYGREEQVRESAQSSRDHFFLQGFLQPLQVALTLDFLQCPL